MRTFFPHRITRCLYIMAYYLPVRHEIDIDADSFMDKVRKTEPKAKSASRSIVMFGLRVKFLVEAKILGRKPNLGQKRSEIWSERQNLSLGVKFWIRDEILKSTKSWRNDF